MNKQYDAYQVVPFPKTRRALIDVMRSGEHMHVIHALLEVDVTKARAFLREQMARTGDAYSFTALIATCLGQVVEENKYLHAYRKGRNQLVLFDEVDVNIMVESEMGGQKLPLVYVIRAANHKTAQQIHAEIRAAQAHKAQLVQEWKRMQRYVLLPTFLRDFFWRTIRHNPFLRKRFAGTCGITAIGMFGPGVGWAIPTAGQTLQLTLGGITEKPGVVDGHIAIRDYLSLTVSLDHEIIDGAPAARFAQRLKELIESGYGLIEQEATSALQESKQEPVVEVAPG